MHSTYYNMEKRKFGDMSYESKYLLDPKYMTKRDLQHYYRYYNMTRNRSQFKKIVVIIFCICFFSYIFIDYNLKTKIIQLRDRFDFIARIDAEYNITPAYFVETAGCRMPFFPVTDDDIIQFMSKPERFSCRKPLTSTSDIGATIFFNMDEEELQHYYNITDLNSVQCYYKEIKRKTDKDNMYGPNVWFKLPTKLELNSSIVLQPGLEAIGVMCLDAESKMFYKDVHFFVIDKINQTRAAIKKPVRTTTATPTTRLLLNSSTKRSSIRGGNKIFNSIEKFEHKARWSHKNLAATRSSAASNSEPAERLSVMVIGIDSVSHLNFLRQMQKSSNYIHKNLTHVEFWGYNKVGDNTFPNIVPVLTGLDESELNISCLEPVKHVNFDRCTFIWKRFKEAGYQTVYAEDVAELGLFNFFQPGFKEQPTDYYLRPVMLEMEKHIGDMRRTNVQLCMGGRRTADVILELIRKLIPYLRTQDFFSFFWTVTMSHDFINTPMLLDSDLRHIFQLFDEAGIFNKTVVFLMSDHGLRWGSFRKTYQGMMEERQPLLIALYPKWLRQKYATAIKNLELNAKRLTTHYDLHATMLDLLDLHNIKDESLILRTANIAEAETMPRGISLFLPVPETRTCEMAGVASHWCLCHQREELPTNDGRVQRAARYIIKLINDRLKAHPQCRTLYLNSISEAIIAAPHHKIVKNLTYDYSIDITVRIQAKPGLGLFESTVRMSSYTMGLTGTISRINLYGSQSYCIDEQALKMFCYCHR